MKYKYVITPAARTEFRLARQWYHQQQVSGLSDRFAQAVKAAIIKIREQPFFYAARYKNVRVIHTEKFPYAIHFYVEEDAIMITAIIFQGRNPMIAKGRIA